MTPRCDNPGCVNPGCTNPITTSVEEQYCLCCIDRFARLHAREVVQGDESRERALRLAELVLAAERGR